MARRVNSDFMLVGSLPASSTEEALRVGGELFGDLVFALPDGETGPRAMWAAYDAGTLLLANPDIVTLPMVNNPPRTVADQLMAAVREGVTELHFDKWPRIDDAIESYEVFRRLRDEEHVIPQGVRFQISLPFSLSVMPIFGQNFERDTAIAAAAFEDLFAREIKRLTAAVPAEDLAIQWDLAWETLDIEGVLSWMQEGDAWERYAGPVRRMTSLIPEEALVGYHFCYGTFPMWPMYEMRDLSVSVRMSNYAIENSGRPVDFLHLTGPRDLRSQDKGFYAPLADLRAPDTRIFLGIILPVDGVEGLRRRHATASQYLDDFGIAMYCGFGRQPGQDGMETMREHRRVVLEGLSAGHAA